MRRCIPIENSMLIIADSFLFVKPTLDHRILKNLSLNSKASPTTKTWTSSRFQILKSKFIKVFLRSNKQIIIFSESAGTFDRTRSRFIYHFYNLVVNLVIEWFVIFIIPGMIFFSFTTVHSILSFLIFDINILLRNFHIRMIIEFSKHP